jgi:hypothetical protein
MRHTSSAYVKQVFKIKHKHNQIPMILSKKNFIITTTQLVTASSTIGFIILRIPFQIPFKKERYGSILHEIMEGVVNGFFGVGVGIIISSTLSVTLPMLILSGTIVVGKWTYKQCTSQMHKSTTPDVKIPMQISKSTSHDACNRQHNKNKNK